MAHSNDIRVRVLDFIRGGGSKTEAARIFKVSRGCIYSWLARGNDISAHKPGPRGSHKVDMAALSEHLKATPDICLSELAVTFGVYPSTLHYAVKRLRMTRKKNVPIFSGNMQKC